MYHYLWHLLFSCSRTLTLSFRQFVLAVQPPGDASAEVTTPVVCQGIQYGKQYNACFT